jgi:hypothetical protein
VADTLYHGSVAQVERIDLSRANPKRDFGAGFYTTSSYEQAVRFCRIVAKRTGHTQGIVNRYSYTENIELSVVRFKNAGLDWLDFVLYNRGYTLRPENAHDEDLIIGPVANDQVGQTLNLLITGAYGDPDSKRAKDFALSLLMPENLVDQWVFKTTAAVDCLEYLGADEHGL